MIWIISGSLKNNLSNLDGSFGSGRFAIVVVLQPVQMRGVFSAKSRSFHNLIFFNCQSDSTSRNVFLKLLYLTGLATDWRQRRIVICLII